MGDQQANQDAADDAESGLHSVENHCQHSTCLGTTRGLPVQARRS